MNNKEEPATLLDKVLARKEKQAAVRYSAAELDKMALQSEREARHMEEHMEETGSPVKTPTETKQDAMKLAITLLNEGVDPKIVGQLLMGNPTNISFPSQGASAPGITIKDIKELMELVSERKDKDDGLRDVLKEFGKKLDSLPTRQPQVDPLAYGKQAAEAVSTMYEAFNNMGLISRSTGRSIEEVKEENRHKERMAVLEAEEKHQKEIAETFASIPEKIGRGVARQLKEGELTEGKSVLQSFQCSKCHKTIFVPPDAGDTLLCGHCGEKYLKKPEPKKELEPKKET